MAQQALVQAGRLKAEIRLAQAVSEFSASLDSSQRLTFRTLRTNRPPSPRDVVRLTEDINREGARTHRSWQPHGTRLVAILDRVQQLTTVGDVLVGGSQNLIAAGVWTAVRMSLLLATGYLSYFDKVSELLMRVGRTSSINQDLASMFPKCRQLQDAMCEYLIIIVNFCRDVVLFTKKPLFRQIGASFTSEFKSVEGDLALWASVIQETAFSLTSKSQVQSENTGSRVLALLTGSQTKQRVNECLSRLKHHLSPFESEFDLTWRRMRRKGTVRWIFSSDAYKSWSQSAGTEVLHIRGSLGVGKSVLLANIYASMFARPDDFSSVPTQLDDSTVAACFFSTYANSRSLESRNIVGSLAHQFLKILATDPSIAEAVASRFKDSIPSLDTEDVMKLVGTLVPSRFTLVAAIDGLDECDPDEAESVVLALARLAATHRVRLCFSSRPESAVYGLLTTSFKGVVQLPISGTARQEEILAFIDKEIDRRQLIRPLNPELIPIIKKALSSQAKGMFLWVSLQIDAIFPRHDKAFGVLCDADILSWLESLPPDLPKAFDRALDRIVDQRYGACIFELAAAAFRPLSVDEFRVALNVKPGTSEWDEDTFPHDAQRLIYLCGGGLLEVDEEALTVGFIHSSVRKHLTSPPKSHQGFRFSEEDADSKLGYICITYLSYATFSKSLTRAVDTTTVPVERLVNTVNGTIKQESSGSTLLSTFTAAATRLRPPRTQALSSEVDIAQLLQKFGRSQKPRAEVEAFLGYAQDHWLRHCRQFIVKNDMRSFQAVFHKLLASRDPSFLRLPFNINDDAEVFKWVISQSHAEMFRHKASSFMHLGALALYDALSFLPSVPGWAQNILSEDSDIVAHFLELSWESEQNQGSDIPERTFEGLKLILLLGGNPNVAYMAGLRPALRGRECRGLLPLSIALSLRSDLASKCVELLVEYGARVNGIPPIVPLHNAVFTENVTGFKMLLDAGASPDPTPFFDKQDTLLQQLARRTNPSHLEMLSILLRAGVETACLSPLPLFCALFEPVSTKSALLLLTEAHDARLILKNDLTSALHYFLASHQSEPDGATEEALVLKLLEMGADPEQVVTEPLLIEYGFRRTPLQRARSRSSHPGYETSLFRALLMFGARPKLVSLSGRGPSEAQQDIVNLYLTDVQERAKAFYRAVCEVDVATFDSFLLSGSVDFERQLCSIFDKRKKPHSMMLFNPSQRITMRPEDENDFACFLFQAAIQKPLFALLVPMDGSRESKQVYMLYSLLKHGFPLPTDMDTRSTIRKFVRGVSDGQILSVANLTIKAAGLTMGGSRLFVSIRKDKIQDMFREHGL